MQLHGFVKKKQKKQNKTKQNRKKRVTSGWTDISGPGPVSVLSISSMYYSMLILHNPINWIYAVHSFSWASNFTSPTKWCSGVKTSRDGWNLPKQAETAGTCPIDNSNQNSFVFPSSCQE